jgi:hypothetical protein
MALQNGYSTRLFFGVPCLTITVKAGTVCQHDNVIMAKPQRGNGKSGL